MRVIAGRFRGRLLQAPDGLRTRPTSDRAKECLFSMLTHWLGSRGKAWADVVFADVFAGSGGIGIEALSRGARTAFFFENERQALAALQKNLKEEAGAEVIAGDACAPPPCLQAPDILFFDAPYGQGLWQRALAAFDSRGWIKKDALIIVETDGKLKENVTEGFSKIQDRSAGRNLFLWLKKEI